MIDVKELRKRGYEDESILLKLRQEFENNFVPEEPDYEEDPMGWVEYWSGHAE